jgi:CheY-like chemotaxis protein
MGATFTVTLPERPRHAEATRAVSPREPGNATLDGLLVLLVDDEDDARQMMAQMLSLYGAKVIPACSAEEALSVLGHEHPDVMVSDVGMPGQDGYELIQQVRSNEAGTKSRLPAVAQPKDRMRALAAGFQHHVPKPADPNELVSVIASLTGRLSANSHRNLA